MRPQSEPPRLQAPPLTVLTLQLTFRVQTDLVLPRWKGALLRGGLGRALRGALCDRNCAGPDVCPLVEPCPYNTVFAPDAEEGRSDLHGLRDAPRPYVVRPPLEPRTNYAPGDLLDFGLVLIGHAIDYLPHVLVAFDELGKLGLGADRGQAKLVRALTLDPLSGRRLAILADGCLQNELLLIDGEDIMTAASRLPVSLHFHFPTPMRIKHNNQFVVRPECHVMVRAALRRISQLCAFYGSGAWDVPFAELVRLAEGVQLHNCQTHWVDWSRTSGATGQRMNLGGFVGSVTYEQVPDLLRVVLLAGSLVHIGKSVVFGHGAYFSNRSGMT